MKQVFFYEGMSCGVCSKSFSQQDDIVACPVCGLPHHRECWNAIGHCRLEELHGTDRQWKRPEAKTHQIDDDDVTDNATEPQQPIAYGGRICHRCGGRNPQYAEFCQRCGRPLEDTPDWGSSFNQGFNSGNCNEYRPFFASAPPDKSYDDQEMLDDISAADYSAVVGPKPEYYLPRFRRLSRNEGGGWNWASFILSGYWLLYRKMYGFGCAILALDLLQAIVVEYVMKVLNITTAEELYRFGELAASNRTYYLYFLSILILGFIKILAQLFLGAFGNRVYYNHCGNKIRALRQRTPDLETHELIRIGGTSVYFAIGSYFIVNFLMQIIQFLFM